MSQSIDDLLRLASDISARPQMFAATPEVAHGLIEALSWVILHQHKTAESLGKCMTQSRQLIRSAMGDVGTTHATTPLLCDKSFPDRESSFSSFQTHSAQFLEALQAAIHVSEQAG